MGEVPKDSLKFDGSEVPREAYKDLYKLVADNCNPPLVRKLSLWESVKHFFKTWEWKREEIVINIPDMEGMFCVPDMRSYTFKEKE